MNRTSRYYFRRSVLSLLISALIYAQPGEAAFTSIVTGIVNGETVDGEQIVDERGTTNDTHIINHGHQTVFGGVSNGSIIEMGGQQDVANHNNYQGQANNTILHGGTQVIYNGGNSSGTIIASGNQQVYNGGTSNGTLIEGGNQYIYKDGTSNGTIIKNGNSYVEGGRANGTVIDGGKQTVTAQGHVDGTTINTPHLQNAYHQRRRY